MLYLFATDSATTSALNLSSYGADAGFQAPECGSIGTSARVGASSSPARIALQVKFDIGAPTMLSTWFKSRKFEGWKELPLVQTQLLGSSP